MSQLRRSSVLGYSTAVLLSATATLIAVLGRPAAEPMLGLPFFVCVILSLWLGRAGPALLASFLSAAALIYLLSSRLDPLSVRGWIPLAQVAVFLLVSLLIIGRTKAREETEDMLATTLSSIGEAVVATDAKGQIFFVNPVAESLLGQGRKEMTGQPLRSVWKELVESDQDVLTPPNGKIVERYVTRLPGYGELYVLRDITERRRAEERRLLLEHVITNMKEGFNIVDFDSFEIIAANSAFEEMLGYQKGELTGQHISVVNAGSREEQVATANAIRQSVEQHGFWRGEVANQRKDGTRRITQATVGMYQDRGRRYLSTIQTDVTERKQAEEALKQSEERFRTLVNSMQDVVFTMDRDQRLVGVFGRWLEGYGLKAGDLLGKRPSEMLPPELATLHEQASQKAFSGQAADFEWTVPTPAGVVHFHTWLSPLRDSRDSVIGVVGVSRDITARKQLEEQLRHAQKMEAIGRLAGGVAHDFNNLLTIITGYSQMLLDELEPGEALHAEAEEILRAGNRAASLTSQLLAFSRRQMIQPQVLDLNRLISNLEKMLRPLIGEHIQLNIVLSPELGQIEADPAQIEQILLNLAANARDAMPQGGQLTIEAANAELDKQATRGRQELRPGPYVSLVVSDTGQGMDAETMSHLFEPFFTTKPLGKGTGLGLSSVYGIVKQNGGDITVSSEPGRGTTFRILLPRIEAAEQIEEAVSVQPSLYRGTETVLLVEDESGVRQLTREMLVRNGYTVLEAGSGPEALRISEQLPGPIDLLLTDAVMLEMSGRELAVLLAASRPAIRVIYMSGYAEDTVAHHVMMDPETAFLQKPFTAAALGQKVREVLD